MATQNANANGGGKGGMRREGARKGFHHDGLSQCPSGGRGSSDCPNVMAHAAAAEAEEAATTEAAPTAEAAEADAAAAAGGSTRQPVVEASA
jgi:hypothetical protein